VVNTIIFLGPSLDIDSARQVCEAKFLPPAQMGDIYLACLRQRPAAIGLIDGLFERTPAVWHKEILYAMSLGVRVYGGSSMGALRAAELHVFGMQGVGRIFQDYSLGKLEDDDEVALVHGTSDCGFASQSEALVNIRYGLEAAQLVGAITTQTADLCLRLVRSQFYPDRSWQSVYALAHTAGVLDAEISALRCYVEQNKPNQKRADALATLARIASDNAANVSADPPCFRFEATSAWENLRAEYSELKTQQQPLRLDRLRNHARLFCQQTCSLQDVALLLELTQIEAQRQHVVLPDRALMLEQFFLRRGIVSLEARNTWCQANDVDDTAAAELARLDFFRSEIRQRFQLRLDRRLVEALKLTDQFCATSDYVSAKWQALEAHAFLPSMQSDISPISEIYAWYRQNYNSALPQDSSLLGFETQRELLDELNSEFLYTQFNKNPA
jgi:hypothetical protein